ncbi:MAG: CcmD family protein [Candidatus Kapaibacterium sp.]
MQFLVENSMYVVLIIAAMIMLGLMIYLSRIDARVRKLERGEE